MLGSTATPSTATRNWSFFKGQPGEQVLYTLDEPASRLIRDAGVVMCYPIGHEYYRAHRCFGRIATELANAGFTVLRFDYRGSGDSDCHEGTVSLADMQQDIRSAIEVLLDHAPVSQLAFIGMRLGATLAAMAARTNPMITTLVLWDMIVDGTTYRKQLESLHSRMLGDLERFRRPRAVESGQQMLGRHYSSSMLREIENLDASQLGRERISDAVLLTSRNSDRLAASMVDRFAPGASVSRHRLERDAGWNDVHRIEEIIIEPEAQRHITTSLRVIHS